MFRLSFLSFVALAVGASAQITYSWPQAWPGQPNTTYGTDWQDYFKVDKLPNVTFDLPGSWAGSISTNTANMPNNSLFFWAFEKDNGSFIAESSEPWGIWLSGGPGYASSAGLLIENGPLLVTEDNTFVENKYSWNRLADWMWVDSPIGVGYSTVQSYPASEDEVALDFLGFMDNLMEVFPNLKTRPLYFAGESYAGRFIPYIMKHYFRQSKHSFKLAKAMLGSPSIQNAAAFENTPIPHILQTYPQIIGYDTDVYDYFVEQAHLCKLDLNLTYPQTGGHFKHIKSHLGGYGHPGLGGNITTLPGVSTRSLAARSAAKRQMENSRQSRDERLAAWKRENNIGRRSSSKTVANSGDLPDYNGSVSEINSWYGCSLYDHVLNFAMNFTYPWNELGSFDYVDIPNAQNPVLAVLDPYDYMNDPSVLEALHAPTNQFWTTMQNFPWNNNDSVSVKDPSQESMNFLHTLATNMTENDVKFILYVGNDDMLGAHFAIESVIQNTTFGGIQGFEHRPVTPWYDDSNEFAGIVHQERNWTYLMIQGVGHQAPIQNPARLYTMVREFLINDNSNGTYTNGTVLDVVAPGLWDNGVLPQGSNPIVYNGTNVYGDSDLVEKFYAHFDGTTGAVKLS